mmetsp:Transcript_13983/g.16965  ORF Transcript_13983/g.16965 Transcript_13983/m.16965 type:complete len:210 (-) Transcript_13983:445-1074(-)
MVDGVAHLATFVYRMRAAGAWSDEVGTNVLDNGAPFYGTYLCKDGKYVAVGCIEPHFYKLLLAGLGLQDDQTMPKQMDKAKWPQLRARLASVFLSKTRDEWTKVFAPTTKYADACLSPVLGLHEVATHPHIAHRAIINKGPLTDKDIIPSPAPKFSRTPATPSPMGKGAVPRDGQNTLQVLQEAGFNQAEIETLINQGDVVQYNPKSKI